jgi:hypothetical protein
MVSSRPGQAQPQHRDAVAAFRRILARPAARRATGSSRHVRQPHRRAPGAYAAGARGAPSEPFCNGVSYPDKKPQSCRFLPWKSAQARKASHPLECDRRGEGTGWPPHAPVGLPHWAGTHANTIYVLRAQADPARRSAARRLGHGGRTEPPLRDEGSGAPFPPSRIEAGLRPDPFANEECVPWPP